jgi:hypothetical protein
MAEKKGKVLLVIDYATNWYGKYTAELAFRSLIIF